MSTIAVVDYGMGNLRSVARALEHVAPGRTRVRVTDRAADIVAADRVVFPGQGAARDCMRALVRHELQAPLLEAARSRPFLGMCMGLQVLLEHSEEGGGTDFLGIIPGRVRRFADGRVDADGWRLKIPHMGWNIVRQASAHALWDGIADGTRFYFVHSYYAQPADAELATGMTDYGHEFCSALARDNLFACQFHPEKSSAAGLRLLANFVAWDPYRERA